MAEASVPHTRIRLAVMPGDGIGPEITAATLHVLDAVDRRFGLGLRASTTADRLRRLARDGHDACPDDVLRGGARAPTA